MNKKALLEELERIIESAYKLERKLAVCIMTLKMERETQVLMDATKQGLTKVRKTVSKIMNDA